MKEREKSKERKGRRGDSGEREERVAERVRESMGCRKGVRKKREKVRY